MNIPADWINALMGGLLIGGACALLLWTHGQILGVSGLVAAVLQPWEEDDKWRAAFLAGLAIGGFLWGLVGMRVFTPLSDRSYLMIAVAGILVGVGTRMANGCTSGHGVCGCSRLSPRSIIATITFIASGAFVVALL